MTVRARSVDNGKTRQFSVRLSIQQAEGIEILSGITGRTMSKELNRILALGFTQFSKADPLLFNKMVTRQTLLELERLERQGDDLVLGAAAVGEVNQARELDKAMFERDEATRALSAKKKQLAEDAKMKAQRALLPGRSKTVFEEEDEGEAG